MTQEKPAIITLVPLLPFAEAWLDDAFTVHRIWQAQDRDAELTKLRDSVRAIASFGHARVDGPLLDKLPLVKIVSLMSVGFDAIDVPACKARGVAVTNTPDVLTDDVADLALALLIAASRRIVAGDRYVRQGRWAKEGHMALAGAIHGKTMAILGLGRIGTAIARRGEAFGLKIVYGGRTKKTEAPWPYFADLVAMARAADFFVIAVPGGAATRHMVDARVIEALGTKGILINIARGSVVDQQALVDALVSGRLGGAALDVFDDEPNVPDSLFGLDNVVLQPHVGSATTETRSKMGRLMVDNLLAHFAGRPLLTPVT
jgi:lactate dehydrogenase-like 2-hydroxyacid dehydrogenase